MNHSDHRPERYDKVRREMDHAILNGRQNAHGTADGAVIVAVAIGTWHDIDDLDRQPVARLDALPFTALAAGTTCDTLAVAQLPRVRCSIVAVVSPKVTRVTVRVTAIGNPLVPADSVIFERSISGNGTPLNTP